MAMSAEVRASVFRLATGWTRFRSDVENDVSKSYCKRALAVPFLDDINSQLHDRLQNWNHVHIVALLPSVITFNNHNIDEAKDLWFQG